MRYSASCILKNIVAYFINISLKKCSTTDIWEIDVFKGPYTHKVVPDQPQGEQKFCKGEPQEK